MMLTFTWSLSVMTLLMSHSQRMHLKMPWIVVCLFFLPKSLSMP